MKSILNTLIIILTFSFSFISASDFKIIGYYADWAIYRNPKFFPKDINPKLVTHINYAFLKVETNGMVTLYDRDADIGYRDDWNTQRPYWGNFYQLSQLKKANPHLKTLISVGGWTLSDTFSEMAAHDESRQRFIEEIILFCKKYDFDGIDLDWEYPCFEEHQGQPRDKKNFTLLLQELHEAAKKQSPPLLLTIAAPAGPWHYKNIEIAKIHHYLDWINLMTYDFNGPWPDTTVTNHHSALYPTKQGNKDLNVESAVRHYLEQGVPPQKIVVGMPLYGRSFANVPPSKDGLFSPYSGRGTGTTEEQGLRFFYDIKNNLSANAQLFWDDSSKVPYMYLPYSREWITFDDENSLRLKCEWLKKMGLGGAMVWELGLDVRPTWLAMRAINKTLEHNHATS
jgi:chitinase